MQVPKKAGMETRTTGERTRKRKKRKKLTVHQVLTLALRCSAPDRPPSHPKGLGVKYRERGPLPQVKWRHIT